MEASAPSSSDTLHVLTEDNRQIKFRLASIDSPERSQAYGQRAKQQLRKLSHDKTVQVLKTREDRSGRTLADIAIGKLNVNVNVVNRGYDWHYVKYRPNSKK